MQDMVVKQLFTIMRPLGNGLTSVISRWLNSFLLWLDDRSIDAESVVAVSVQNSKFGATLSDRPTIHRTSDRT
jgi:hypothetical protein